MVKPAVHDDGYVPALAPRASHDCAMRIAIVAIVVVALHVALIAVMLKIHDGAVPVAPASHTITAVLLSPPGIIAGSTSTPALAPTSTSTSTPARARIQPPSKPAVRVANAPHATPATPVVPIAPIVPVMHAKPKPQAQTEPQKTTPLPVDKAPSRTPARHQSEAPAPAKPTTPVTAVPTASTGPSLPGTPMPAPGGKQSSTPMPVATGASLGASTGTSASISPGTPGTSAQGKSTLAQDAPKNVTHLDCRIARPEYPLLSKRRGETGTAYVHFVVSLNGQIENIELRTSSGYSQLDNAALTAMRNSSCKPCLENGAPVRAARTQPFRFDLQN